MVFKIYKWGPLASTVPSPPRKSQIVIYSILLEFETQHFHMFINDN